MDDDILWKRNRAKPPKWLDDFVGQHNHGDGVTALEHARAHRAAMSAERRAQLDGEW